MEATRIGDHNDKDVPNNLPFGVVTFKRHIRKFKNFNFCLEGYTSQENKDKLTLFSAMYIGFFVQQRHDRCFRALTKKKPSFLDLGEQIFLKN